MLLRKRGTGIGFLSDSRFAHPGAEIEVRQSAAGNQRCCSIVQTYRRSAAWNFSVGYQRTFWATDITLNTEYSVPATCRAVGTNCYIFVEDSNWNTRVTQVRLILSERPLIPQLPAMLRRVFLRLILPASGPRRMSTTTRESLF